ncbi:universal stress protein [Mesorhizobium sp. SB112]|uniref:universal stress protein n=1 Tax=Mesorhizobium sp. SB112 TaxID=3151853 RepID=UPI003267F1E6
MYNHILVATDGSEVAQKGLDHGLSLAKSLGGRATIITVTEPYPFHAIGAGAGWVPSSTDIARYEEGQKDIAEKILASAKAVADKLGLKARALHVTDVRPAEAIIEAAKTEGCSLIVMASHGRRGLGRLLLGSQTSEVLAHSPVPVLVIR